MRLGHASPCRALKTARFGQPCAACQAKSGQASAAKSTAPKARCLLRSSGRAARVQAKPSSSPATRKPMFHFAVIAMPQVAPMASHQRGLPLVSSRVTSHSRTVQNRKSGTVVVSSCIAPRYWAQQAVAIAASSWPRGLAPSCRAIDPVSTTIAAKASAGSARSPASVFPVSSASRCASSGVSSGWST